MAFPVIKCIFFAEFHPVQGPRVTFSTPDQFPVTSIFDAVSECVIPKPPLCDSLVAICVDAYKIIGYPIMIENPKYDRNVSIWNLAMVVERETPTYGTEQAIKKLAGVLRTMEIENEFLYNASTKASIQEIIERLLDDLNFYKESHIALNDTYSINLKLFPVYRNPPEIQDHQVPVAVVDLKSLANDQWDKSLQRIAPYINGVHYVRKISELADVDVDLTRACLQHLAYFECIKFIDIFQFSNIYRTGSSLRQLARDESVQAECSAVVTRPGAVPPTLIRLLSLYTAFKPGLTVRDVVAQTSFPLAAIDIRKFIVFAVLRGWLVRVHRWPVAADALSNYVKRGAYVNGNGNGNTANGSLYGNAQGSATSDSSRLKRMLDGSLNTDQLCVTLRTTYKDLAEALARDLNVVWFEK
ncbi:Nitrogen permease regulator 2 [Sorochytrium milnesiophthora]